MSANDQLRQYHQKSAERLVKFVEKMLKKMEQGKKPKFNVVIHLPRGEAISTITSETFKPFVNDFPNIRQWLMDEGCEINRYDIHEIEKDSEYELRSKYFDFLPTLIACDRYGFVWENEHDDRSPEQAYSWFEEFLATFRVRHDPNRKETISIDLLVKEAKFGPIQLNMSKAIIGNIFGPPEFYDNPFIFGHKKAMIWKYGAWQFHFNPDSDQLRAIENNSLKFRDSFATEARTIGLTDLFFYEGDKLLSKQELEQKFIDVNMDFCYFKSVDSDAIKVSLANGIEIFIDMEEDGVCAASELCLSESFGSNQLWTPMV